MGPPLFMYWANTSLYTLPVVCYVTQFLWMYWSQSTGPLPTYKIRSDATDWDSERRPQGSIRIFHYKGLESVTRFSLMFITVILVPLSLH
jgi:hypothetical protein